MDNPKPEAPQPASPASATAAPAAVNWQAMLLATLTVENYRSIARETFEFGPLAVLIGKNNAGKSNVLSALAFLLEGTSKDIRDGDYFNPSEELVITATLMHVSGYLPLSEEKHRSKIESCLIDGDAIQIRRRASRAEGVAKLEIWQPGKDEFGTPTGIEAGLKQILPYVIPVDAFLDPSDEVQTKQSAALGKLLAAILDDVRKESEEAVKSSFAMAGRLLNPQEIANGTTSDDRTPRLRAIEDTLSRRLAQAFTGAEARIRIDLPELPQLLAGARIELNDGGQWTEPRLKGQGMQRSLCVALLLTLAEEKRRAGSKAVSRPFILLIEEPEVFLHPSGHGVLRRALETIAESDQVIFTTHSPTMVSPQRLSETILVRKTSNGGNTPVTVRLQPLSEELKGHEKRIRHLFEYGRSSKFLFSERVLVVEGPSDVDCLDAICTRLNGRCLDDCSLACVDSGNKTTVKGCMEVLSAIGLQVFGLVDVDFLWRGAGVLLGGDAAYSTFCGAFWSECEKQGIVVAGQREIPDRSKKDAIRLVTTHFSSQIEPIITHLRDEHSIWVLSQGELEDYVGLSRQAKGDYTIAASEIRAGERALVHEDELRALLAWMLAKSLEEEDVYENLSSN